MNFNQGTIELKWATPPPTKTKKQNKTKQNVQTQIEGFLKKGAMGEPVQVQESSSSH